MREVARLADVSVATVSMVLNNNPRISQATRDRVQGVMEQVGYRPNRNAQSLSSKYTRLLAVLIPRLRHAYSDPYFGELISGIADRAGQLGNKLILEQATDEFVDQRKHLDLFERRFIDGLLCLGVNDEHPFVGDLVDAGYPTMVVNNLFDDTSADHVVCDYRAGAEQVMQFLDQLGHQRVALLHGSSQSKTMRIVLDVYRQWMGRGERDGVASGGVASWIADGLLTEEGGAAATRELLERHPDLTAIFAVNDKMALGAMHQVFESGRRVPDDVSVVGFDDLQSVAFVNPTLTTVNLPLYDVGVQACDLLIQKVRGKRTGPIQRTLPTRLVLRNSTARARG